MKKYILVLCLILIINEGEASVKKNIIDNLKKINNISFNFSQNINGKTESGSCKVLYPKKIYCNYNSSNKKILISNGKSLLIKTNVSNYLYPLEKTPLNLILDKNLLLNKIQVLEERIIDDELISFSFEQNDNKINIFFNKLNFDLVGWQTTDIYQNLNITYISSIIKNTEIDDKIFFYPNRTD